MVLHEMICKVVLQFTTNEAVMLHKTCSKMVLQFPSDQAVVLHEFLRKVALDEFLCKVVLQCCNYRPVSGAAPYFLCRWCCDYQPIGQRWR